MIDESNYLDILTEMENKFYDIPFSNSKFQIDHFVIADQTTPARAYRMIGVNIIDKLQTLKETITKLKLAQVDLDEMKYKLAKESKDSFKARRLKIKIENKIFSNRWTQKMISDCVAEIQAYKDALDYFPEYTRENFEAEERIHFEMQMNKQIEANGDGALESIHNMRMAPQLMKKLLNDPNYLENVTDEVLKQVAQDEDIK